MSTRPVISVIPQVLQGLKFDSIDDRDQKFGLVREYFRDTSASASAPKGDYDIPEYTPISSQDYLNFCTSNAWCDMLEMLIGIETPEGMPVPQLSRLFHSWAQRCQEGEQKKNVGSYLRTGAKVLKNVGVCLETTWPYELEAAFTSPPQEAFDEASDNKIEAFYSLDATGEQRADDVEALIRSNHPIVFGTTVGTVIRNYDPDTVLDIPGDSIGNHAMIMTGVRTVNGRRVFVWRNSWGSEFGRNGHLMVTEAYVKWSSTRDLWVGTRLKGLTTLCLRMNY